MTTTTTTTSKSFMPTSIDADAFLSKQLNRINQALELNQKLIDQIKSRKEKLEEQRDALYFVNGSDYEEEELRATSTIKKGKTVTLVPFFKPYFRDSVGISGPQICDKSDIEPSLMMLMQMPKHVRPWTEEEKVTLLDEVCAQHLPHYHKELIDRLEGLLAESQQEAQRDVKPPELIAQIKQLNTELASASTKKMEPERWSPHIDWLVVAKQMPPDRTSDDCELFYNNLMHKSISREKWTEEEDRQLEALVMEHGNDWDLIASKLTTRKRLAWQCCARYQSELNADLHKKGKIDGAEASFIREVIERYRFGSYINWNNVSCIIEGRSVPQMKHYYRKLNDPTIIRKWSELEDRMILVGVRLFGNNWTKIAHYIPLRNNRQIRERYKNQLDFTQKRKFGHWTQPEDELILEMSIKYRKEMQGIETINFPEIQRLYFPNRNVYQVYRRYLYLRKSLPESAFEESNDTLEGSAMMELFKSRKITRRRIRSKGAPLYTTSKHKLPDDPEKLQAILVQGRKELMERASNLLSGFPLANSEGNGEDNNEIYIDLIDENEEEDEQLHQFVNRGRRSLKKEKIVVPIAEPEDPEAAVQSWQYNILLSGLVGLNDLRFQPKGIALSQIDLNANSLLQMVIREAIDPAVESNFKKIQLQSDEKEAKLLDFCELYNECTSCSLDSIRYFLTSKLGMGSAFHQSEQEDEDEMYTMPSAKAILPPNYITLFSYSMLRLAQEAMVIRLTSAKTSVLDQQDVIAENSEFQDLRAMFLAIFAWPAFLGSSHITEDGKLEEILMKRATKSTDVDEEEELPRPPMMKQEVLEEVVGEVPKKRGRGRPPKRKFFSTPDHFVRRREYQANIFFTHIRKDTMRMLHQEYPFNVSRYWPLEPREDLQERVKLFLDIVYEQVDATCGQSERSQQKRAKKAAQALKAVESAERKKTTVPKPRKPATPTTDVRRSERRRSKASTDFVEFAKEGRKLVTMAKVKSEPDETQEVRGRTTT